MAKKSKAQKPHTPLPIPPTEVIPIDMIDLFFEEGGLENPNELSGTKMSLLKAGISKYGFLQPVLVRKKSDGRYGLLDGHHRIPGAVQAGMTEVSAVVLPEIADWQAIGHALGMNRIRGDMNITIAAELMGMMQEELSLPVEDISVITGFSESEVMALLDAAEPEDAIMDTAVEDQDEDAPLPRPFLLELTFDSSATRTKVKRLLRKASGSTKDLTVGLMNILQLNEDTEE